MNTETSAGELASYHYWISYHWSLYACHVRLSLHQKHHERFNASPHSETWVRFELELNWETHTKQWGSAWSGLALLLPITILFLIFEHFPFNLAYCHACIWFVWFFAAKVKLNYFFQQLPYSLAWDITAGSVSMLLPLVRLTYEL